MREYWVWDADYVDPEQFAPDVAYGLDAEDAATDWLEDNWGDLDYPASMNVAVARTCFDGVPTFAQVGHLEVFRVEAEETVTFIARKPD